MNTNLFISVDWGTSNFRLRLVERSSLKIMEQLFCQTGVGNLFSQWQTLGGRREDIFLHFLRSQIDLLTVKVPGDIRIIISGMASSSMGIRELPYASLPFNIDGTSLYTETIKHPLFPYGIYLISGFCSDSDIIRGEEVQIIGLAHQEDHYQKSIFILPGTHSKHLMCERGQITGFNTYMTGELFQVLSSHSILKDSIEKPPPDFDGSKAFEQGVLRSREGFSLLNNLFKVRAEEILGKRSANENYYYLSGLLIGEEIGSLCNVFFDKIQLCAGNNLYEFYEHAIRILDFQSKTRIIDKEVVESSVIRGQIKILENNC